MNYDGSTFYTAKVDWDTGFTNDVTFTMRVDINDITSTNSVIETC